MEKEFFILENGNEMAITKEERDQLVQMGVIYHCSDCGGPFYHVGDKMNFEEIDKWLLINSK